jgi:glycosyltransferase involved in cell wall biosynthesis
MLHALWKRCDPRPAGRALWGRVDLIHGTTYALSRSHSRDVRLVDTVFDLTFMTHPELHLPENVAYCRAGLDDALDRADALIAISETTRREPIERAGASPQRTFALPLAASSAFSRVRDAGRLAAVRSRYALPPAFVLCVGTLEPRKNLLRLLEAFAALSRAARVEAALVVAGGEGWLSRDLPRRGHEVGLEGRTHFLGFVPAADLPVLYSLATVFAYPSLYEGFGLPVVEAMACAPVLTSEAGTLPEVTGEAALRVDPLDVYRRVLG